MGLNNFLKEEEKFGDHYEKFKKLKEQFKTEGLPETLAEYKALNFLTPDKLEKISLAVKNSDELRIGVTFFFDSEEELKLVAKYFNYNPTIAQVRSSALLLSLLRLLDEKTND
jgi:hypothetical protein